MIGKTWFRHVAAALALFAAIPAANAQLIISQFRLRGPSGANDEFIEIYNNSGADHTVAGTGTGYAVAASDGVARCVIQNGTVIPNRGHYLCANSVAYSLTGYPAGNGTTATGDATFTTDIPDNAGIAIFNTSVAANFNLANRMDAVGSTSEANTLYKEGTGYPALVPFSIDYAFVRDTCGKGGSITATGPCTIGTPKDTNNNAADFIFVDSNGTSAGAGQRLGAPGPANLSSPIAGSSGLTAADLDSCATTPSPPNRVRDFTSDPANNSTFGTLDIRQTFTNTPGRNLTRMRFRVVDLTTFPAPSGVADLRPRTSTAVVVTVDRPPCGSGTSNITVNGTTLEQPPSQPNGGGFNSSMSVGTVTLATPLANGASVDVRFLLGIQQTGYFKFGIVPETLPTGYGFSPMVIEGCTDGCPAPPPLVISEFRLRGPNGAADEFIEIANNSNSSHTVTSTSAGYALAASDGVTRGVIPNGTVIPAHGHYLIANSTNYSIAGYPAGNGTTASADATYTTDIPDNAGIALFSTSNPATFNSFYLIDAVGTTSEANPLYKKGTGLPVLTPFSINSAFVRDACGKAGNISTFGACPSGGSLVNSGNNAADFIFVDTNGTSAGAGQRLGTPGPENLSSPISGQASLGAVADLDSCSTTAAAPNSVRDLTSDPANNSTFGTLDIRQTYTNTSGAPLTRLRFRMIDLTTFPAPSGIADLRPRTSADATVTVDRPPCGSGTSNITVHGTSLEQPPSQLNGGGFNSSLSADSVTLATPLADGASIDVHFLLGIQQTGHFRIGLVPEGLPAAGTDLIQIEGFTDVPTVVSIVRASPSPTGAATVDYTVTFSEAVNGVDATDFTLTTSGLSGTSVGTVSGSGAARTVTVNTGTGSGTLRLDLVDNDSIVSASTGSPLGGIGAGNGSFNTGEVYTIDHTPPTVTINQAAGQADPVNTGPINFTATFSKPVTGFTASGVTLSGTAGATTKTVTGGPSVYNVAVTGMATSGTVIATIAAGVATDAAANPNAASTSTDNVVTFDNVPPSVVVTVPGSQLNPTTASPIHFTVTFSEPVVGFTTGDVVVGGTTGATASVVMPVASLAKLAVVSGGPAVYDVAVSGMVTNGTVTLSVPAGVATDLAGNPNTASTGPAAAVFFAGFASAVPAPSLTWPMLIVLAALLVGLAAWQGQRIRKR